MEDLRLDRVEVGELVECLKLAISQGVYREGLEVEQLCMEKRK